MFPEAPFRKTTSREHQMALWRAASQLDAQPPWVSTQQCYHYIISLTFRSHFPNRDLK
jgi:hypothetical protein